MHQEVRQYYEQGNGRNNEEQVSISCRIRISAHHHNGQAAVRDSNQEAVAKTQDLLDAYDEAANVEYLRLKAEADADVREIEEDNDDELSVTFSGTTADNGEAPRARARTLTSGLCGAGQEFARLLRRIHG
jgi:hypothetical protein